MGLAFPSLGRKPSDSISVTRKETSDSPKPSSIVSDSSRSTVSKRGDELQRRLGNREIQLLAIGGSIGTALFVSIGTGLYQAGPGGLFLAYLIYTIFLGLVNNCIAEMTTYMPIAGGFPKLAGHWVDDAFGFMAGYNFFLYEALLIPFEITALVAVLGFWRDDIPAAAVIAVSILLYAILNVLAVKAYGAAEFWLSSGKVLLIFVLFTFTFVVMVGGNPERDAFGFRYWNDPGAFAAHLSTGALGRFEGFLAGLWSASFTCVGPEYISMVAAEAKHPRLYIKKAFKTVYWRFGIFFVLGSLCVGILISHRDPTLQAIVTGDNTAAVGTAAASPYVIAMENLRVRGLPSFVNALLVTSIFSAGNTYTYCATRSLYGLALEGRAPAILRTCTKSGVPVVCFAIVMIFPCLAFLQLGSGASKVLGWLINLITAGGLINYIVITTTYIFFYRACKAQGFDRKALPYTGWFQPYSAYLGLAWMIIMVTCYGYSAFKPWDVSSFFTYYTMVIVSPVLFVFWKLLKRTKVVKASEADLIWEVSRVTQYESTTTDPITGFWREMVDLVLLRSTKPEREADRVGLTWSQRRSKDVRELFELSDRTKADIARRAGKPVPVSTTDTKTEAPLASNVEMTGKEEA